jgi:c-di-GMP-related signal transduction protein
MGTEKRKENYLIGRQPILNMKDETVAYELYFRSTSGPRTNEAGKEISHTVANGIMNIVSRFGLDQILGVYKGLIKADVDLLMGDVVDLLPKERIILELPGTISVTPELLQRCNTLKEAGFELSLDDHDFAPTLDPLYKIIHTVKVHPFRLSTEQLTQSVKQFRAYPVKLLAEKVETREEFLQCRGLGFDLFQGYFFAKPSVLEKKPIDEASSSLFKLMRLLSEDAEMDAIEKVFRGSSVLTYKLLLLVNSVALGLRQKVETVRHALAIVGRQKLQRWVQLALFASDDGKGMESPLVDMAAVRATFMEQVAASHPLLRGNRDSIDQAYMVGMLSLFESQYKITLDEMATSLNLSETIKEALSPKRGGILGQLLELAELMENPGSWVTEDQLTELKLKQEDVLSAQMKAFSWLGEMAPAGAGASK